VVSLRKAEIDKVARYIDRQEEHHRRGRVSEVLEQYECKEDDWAEGDVIVTPLKGVTESGPFRPQA
jgi:hypothetical protein